MKTIEETIAYFQKEGINFIPLQYGDKKPVSAWKEYQKRKITDDEIDVFFRKSQHNIGAVCGAISNNLWVIDADSMEIADKLFPRREQMIWVKTGRGAHFYFKADASVKPLKIFDPEGREIVTLKSEGGYVLAPGSKHPNGHIYEMMNTAPIPVLSGDVREQLKARALKVGLNFGAAEGSSEIIDIENLLLGVVRGGQDNAILHLSHYLRRQGAAFEEALSILQTWNKRNTPIIPGSELHEKLHNHYRLPESYSFYYKSNPAKISIMSDLTLRRTDSIISVNIQDMMDEDAQGRSTINRDKVCDYLESKYNFKGVMDSGELYFYEDGIYVSRPAELDRILQRLFGADATIHFKSEMRKQILDRNPVKRSEMNGDLNFIPVENGLLNLETFHLEPFTPDRFFTSGISVRYDTEATAPEFLGFIGEIVRADDIPVMQEWFGYCLYRDYPNAKALFLIGDGGNGKSVLTQILTAFLNRENVSFLPLSDMDGHHRFSTFSLFSKFLNIASEPPTDKMLETSLFKLITGKSPIEAEQKGVQARLKFTSFAKIVVEANTVPRIADSKQALWDRIIPVEFPNSFRGRPTEIINLAEQLSTAPNLSGILNWALEGLKRLMKNNFQFTISRSQENKKTEMQIETNPLLAFQDHWLVFSRKFETTTQTIYDAYELFCVVNKIPSLNKGIISKSMMKDSRIDIHRVRESGLRLRIFKGCSLSDTVIAVYGRYRDRPLRPGEVDDIENPEEEVEIRTCCLSDYLQQYIEPAEEVQEVIGDKLFIFNSTDLVELYKQQAARGDVKHLGPQTRNPEQFSNNDKKQLPPEKLSLTALSPIDQGICELCGKTGFLTHEVFDEDGTKSLVCKICSTEIQTEMGKEQPIVFNTTLEERRAKLKELEEKEINK